MPQAHLSGQPLGDEHPAAGEERQAPRRRDSIGERGDRIRLRRVVRRTSLLRKLRRVVWFLRGTRVDRPALDQPGRCRGCRGTLSRGLRVCDRRNEREHQSADDIVCSRRHSPDYMTGLFQRVAFACGALFWTNEMTFPSGSRTQKSRPPHACLTSRWAKSTRRASYSWKSAFTFVTPIVATIRPPSRAASSAKFVWWTNRR